MRVETEKDRGKLMLTLPIKKKWFDMILSGEKTVVHCKDCKYCEHTLKRPNAWKPNETSEEHYNCLRIENGIQPIVFPDSFCSFGKYGDMRVTL